MKVNFDINVTKLDTAYIITSFCFAFTLSKWIGAG